MDTILDFIKSIIETLGISNFAFGSIIVVILAKVLPNEALQKIFEGAGEVISGFCNRWKWWQKVEDWLIEGLAVSVTALIKGLRKDNSN